jgi:hypothetical protein
MISKGMDGVTTVERVITPEVAASMLATNAMNRPIGRSHVSRLAESMKRGEWDLNGSTIKVACTGRLLDGQHRLSACVESGCSFSTLVVYGLPESSFATIDQGSRTRKISDVLSIETGSNMKNTAAALVVLYQFREFREIPASGAKSVEGFSVSVAREMLNKHPGIVGSTAASNSIVIWRNAQCAAIHYLFGMVDRDLAGEFAEVLRCGSSKLRRPFNVFREGIIRLRNTSATPNRREAAARAIKAFNAERSGRSVGILTWRSNEEFPKIDGLDYDLI